MGATTWQTVVLFTVIFWGRLMVVAASGSVRVPLCPKYSFADAIFGFRNDCCSLDGDFTKSSGFIGVTEGDEGSLQKALGMVHKSSQICVAVLFYASWCSFSRSFRPNFSLLSSLYPSIPHFAIEESAIRPSTLSKYGVHGFPTLFLLNSTIRVRYQGARTVGSLVAFYSDITGVKAASLDRTALYKIGHASNLEKHGINEQETCPFSWARSPENLLRHETYLTLATVFVLLRLLYLLYPTLLTVGQFTWRRVVRNVRVRSLLDHPLAYLKRAIQLFNSPREPHKRSNLQEGARNARAWASKSLATVSIGDASTSRGVPVN